MTWLVNFLPEKKNQRAASGQQRGAKKGSASGFVIK